MKTTLVRQGTDALFGGDGAGYPAPGVPSGGVLRSLAFDRNGNLYVADPGNSVIRKIDPSGLVTTWAGQPGEEGYRNGQRANARFSDPSGIAVDREGIVYVTETDNHCIRKITPAGAVATIGGDPAVGREESGNPVV